MKNLPGARTPAQLKVDARTFAAEARNAQARVATTTSDTTTDPAPAGKAGELWLYGLVGGYWFGFNAESVSEALRDMGDIDTLSVRIHSPGGAASEGIAISNLLRNHQATVTVVVDGLAASAASVIALAGDDIVMCPGSQMMLHDASCGAWGNAEDLRKAAEWIDGQSQNYAGVYATRAGGSAASWRDVMLAETWYTAEDAVKAGLATRVGNVTAVGSPPTAPADQLEDDLEDDELLAAARDLALLAEAVHPAARAAWQGRPAAKTAAPKPPTASAGGSTTHKEENDMSFITDVRAKLGITAEDADEATILAALDEALNERAEPAANPTVPEGHVVVPEVRLNDLEQAAARGVQAAQTLHERDREAFLDANKSKFPASSRAEWAKRYDKDPTATVELLTAAADLVPVNDLGHANENEDSSDAVAVIKADPKFQSWEV